MIYYIKTKPLFVGAGLLGPALASAARAAEAWIRLERVDQLQEIIRTQNTLKLETGAVFGSPYLVRFDPAKDGEANRKAFAAAKFGGASSHEAVGRKIYDMQVHITKSPMLADHLEVDGVARRTAHLGYGKLCSGHF
jgi:hypothetical protein